MISFIEIKIPESERIGSLTIFYFEGNSQIGIFTATNLISTKNSIHSHGESI